MSPRSYPLEGEHPDGTPREYEPHEQDPDALTRVCPACLAPIGSWCGGAGDVHAERVHESDAKKPA